MIKTVAKYQIILLIILNLFFISDQSSAAVSVQPCDGVLHDCEYYLCRESIQRCGKTGYYVRFAYPYCEKFMKQVKPQFSVEGRLWLDHVGQCLRDSLNEVPNQSDCKVVEDQALESHLNCYLNTGFCQISFREKLQILRVVYKELTDRRMMNVFLEISRKCEILMANRGNAQ